MFYNFYSARNYKTANNSTTDEAKEKNKHGFGILRILEKSMMNVKTKFEKHQILIHKN